MTDNNTLNSLYIPGMGEGFLKMFDEIRAGWLKCDFVPAIYADDLPMSDPRRSKLRQFQELVNVTAARSNYEPR